MKKYLLSFLTLITSVAMGQGLPQTFQKIIDESIDNKYVYGCVLKISSPSIEWTGSSGNLESNSQYFIASTTKLYITAIIQKYRSQHKLRLDDPIYKYLSNEELNNLHHFKGTDYTQEICIKHLLAQTSGLNDYLEDTDNNGYNLLKDLLKGNDKSWHFDDVLNISRKMDSHFRPAKKGKAYYSDTNYQILGRIIEIVSGKTISEALKEEILQPLGLHSTYLYKDTADEKPQKFYYKQRRLKIPKAMVSVGADGGIVSNVTDSMIFIRAFFNGTIFPKEYLDDMYQWNPIFFPFHYGIGLMQTRIFLQPILIGHSGITGAFSFYCPEKETFIVGTLNQIDQPSRSFKLMLKFLRQL